MRPQPLRCPNCETRLGDFLEGHYETLCPRPSCKKWVRIVRKPTEGINTAIILDRVKAVV